MWSAIKRFFSWLFSSCLGGKKPKQNKSEASLLQDDALAQRETEHDQFVSAFLESSTNGIGKALETGSPAAPAVVDRKIIRQPSAPVLLTAHEKSVIVASARCGSNVYIDKLDDNKQSQAADAIMDAVQASFKEISANIETIKAIAKAQEHENHSQLSHAEQLSFSWNSMSRDILNARNANEKSINYRCTELLSHASDNMIQRLVSEIMSIFATCKSMLAANIFKTQAHTTNLKNVKSLSDDAATTSEGQFFNNANRRTQALLDRFNQNSENEEASLAHQSSVNL